MEGDGMVAVVRGLREAGLAVTLLDGSRQYNLLPNTTTQPASTQRTAPVTIANASTQQCPPKSTAATGTEMSASRCDRDAQVVDGRYASTYKTMHCNVRPTSPPVQLTEFPPQRPDLHPGHGNFIVGGTGSGATNSEIRASSPTTSFRGGLSWPDRGSVCSPRPSRAVDAFANSLRKYPNCLSPDRSSEVMERLVNYTQPNKGASRSFRKSPSPSRIAEHTLQNVLEPKSTSTRSSQSRTYEPNVTVRPKKTEEPPTRDWKKDQHQDRPARAYDVRCIRDITKNMRDRVNTYTSSYSYNHPVCSPTIVVDQDHQPTICDCQNSSNSVDMEIQAAVKMLSKEVSTLPREDIPKETVAVPEASMPSTTEKYTEGEFYIVENLDITTSIKSIQTTVYPSDTTLKPRKSVQTVFSTIDFHSSRNRTIVSRKTKSQEEIKLTQDELKFSLLELINEISDTVSKNTVRDELIKKLFVTDNSVRNDLKCDRGSKSKHDKCYEYESGFCQPSCYYVGDYQDLLHKFKDCFDGANQVLRSEIKPFRLSEYRQLDFVVKDWVNQLNLKTCEKDMQMDRSELLCTVENRIKELLKNWTQEDFDLKSEIVEILEELPIELNTSYNPKSYLRKLVDVLLKRMRNVILTQQSGKVRKKSFASRSRKILTEKDMRELIRAHLLDLLNECNSRICSDTLEYLENELVDLMLDSIDCIWRGHDDAIIHKMNILLQDIGNFTAKQANYLSNSMLQKMLNNCVFNQTYTILNVSNNTGHYMNATNNTDFSIGSITEDDLNMNLDSYTNQLCEQINQWLDTLDIPKIQDSGFREVVVNDLAGDIVDRHKYVELNHTGKDTAQDQLEALKYQIFKWINKLVGDDNQETISHAENLLQRINNIPVPMLVNPQHRNGGTCCEVDNNICPNSSKGSPKTFSLAIQGLNKSGKCCRMNICPNSMKGHGLNQSCCEMNICPNEGGLKRPGNIGHTGYLPHTDQIGGSYEQSANAYHPHQGQSTPKNRSGNGCSFRPVSPNHPWSSYTFSTGFEPSLAGSLNQSQNGAESKVTMDTFGRIIGTIDPNHQVNNRCCPSTSKSQPAGLVPVKKLNEDYDEYLKQWVKKLPIVDITPTEKQAAETARLGVYNGIWKAVTKMKLDPNIFAHQYYCLGGLEEEIERLLKEIPQSQELEVIKPMLKSQLLQKTLAVNDLIKSTNAPASFKQQLIDNIENNLPKRIPRENETDKEYDDIEKRDLADYYILFTRYKGEDSAKAGVHKKNFLKKLDEFLNKIKNRHNIVDMDTTAYANEIINSFDKIPTPNNLAVKDEADDILIAMEVENWISDIPLKSDNSGPPEKRRTRDAIVKKIHDIGVDVSCCDSGFRIPMKSELPKYLEKLPIQEGTNVEYLVDQLANRINNLATTTMRRVSFQDPQNYEEFSQDMPAASSLHKMSEDRSYMVVGGDIVKDTGSRWPRWMTEQAPVPEDDIKWISMERTQMPSIMHSGSVAPQGMQSQMYNTNKSGCMSQRPQSSQVCGPNASRRLVSDIPRVGGPNLGWERERAAVPQKRPRLSTPLTPDPRPNLVSKQTTVPQEDIQWLSLEETQMPSQIRSESDSPRRSKVHSLNASEQMATQISYPNSQQVQGQFYPYTEASFVPNSGVNFFRNAHGQYTSFNMDQFSSSGESQLPPKFQQGELCTGPPCCPNSLCNRTQDFLRSGTYPQSNPHSPGPREPFSQQSPNARGMPCCNDANMTQTSWSDRGSPDRYSKSFGHDFDSAPHNIRNGSVSGYQMQQQEPNASRRSQGSNVQDCQGTHRCSVPNNQGQSFGSRDPAYNHHHRPLSTSLSIGLGYGPYFGQRPNGAHMGQVGQGTGSQGFSQAPVSPPKSGPASIFEGSGQGYSDAQHNASTPLNGMYLPSLRQNSHSPGPVSAASQVTDQAPRPFNLQKSVCGGIRGIGQGTGPNTRTVRMPTSSGPSALYYPSTGAQAVGTTTIQPGVTNSIGDRSILIKQKCTQQPSCKTDQDLEAVCIPSLFLDRPKGCSSPDENRERKKCKCIRHGKKFRPRIKMDLNDDQVEYRPCTSMEPRPTHIRTVGENEPAEEPNHDKIKPLDVNEREVFNYKSVQTALSTINITTTKCKYCEARSKSQEELTRTVKQKQMIRKTNLSRGDLQQEVTEWFEIQSDKMKVKLWGEKMKKLAEKLKKPGGEEKLRIKIEKFLNRAPEKHLEDADILDFRKRLPNDIIRKLKKIDMCPRDTDLSVYRMELPKYCSRFMMDNFKKAVLNWMKTLNIRKKDFLGRNVKKDDVFKYVADKLEPLVLDRPHSDSEYKIALKSNISEIVYELPLALSSHNKNFYLNKVTQSLVDKLILIENKFSSTYIQPTNREIKEFVKDEITFFLENCRFGISTKKMEYLETELIEILLDLTDIADIDSNVVDNVTKLLKEVTNLPEYKAKYFTNLLLKDYKEFFFRENFFQLEGNSDRGRPDVYSAFQNATGMIDFNAPTSFEKYRQQLIEEINKWINKINIPVNDKKMIEVVVKNLASDIIDRYKYLLLNPTLTGTDAEELEQLKFQIFKWTSNLVGKNKMSVVENAHELMKEIKNIPKPSLQKNSVIQSMLPLSTCEISYNTKPYTDILTDEVNNWHCELPTDFKGTKLNKQCAKTLAENIEKSLDKKENEVIEKEVGRWTDNVFKAKLSNNDMEELKNNISNIVHSKRKKLSDLKHEKTIIRAYEDIVDEWIDTIPITLKRQEIFAKNKNEIVHSIAVKILKIKTKIQHLSADVVEKLLREELSHWLKKLPLHTKVDNQHYRDKYASELVKVIQRHNMKDSLRNQSELISDEPEVNQLEKVMREWLFKLPLYKEKSLEEKLHLQTIIKELAHKLNESKSFEDLEEEITKLIRMLQQKDENLQDTAFHLKQYLEKHSLNKDLSKQHEHENTILDDTIEVWLKELPLQVTDITRFNKQKRDFIKNIKRSINSGADNAVLKKEIVIFIRTFPISNAKKYDYKYFNDKVLELIQSLKIEINGDLYHQAPNKNKEMINNAIKQWAKTLPLKPGYCPRELRSFIDDMSSVIGSYLLNKQQNDGRLYREITKYLRKFPLTNQMSTESHIFHMTGELVKILKNIRLFQNKDGTVFNNVSVYDVSIENKVGSHTADYSVRSIKKSDINEFLEAYTKQLIQLIGDWFDRLDLPESHQEGFKQVVINDLAGDIVDRHKYLELNPNIRGTEKDELEHLKYQIFKWINKLVGEENHDTIGHAEELMQMIKRIPVPNPIKQSREPVVSFSGSPSPRETSSNQNNPNNSANRKKSCCSQSPPPPTPPAEEGTKEAMYDKYVKIFKELSNSIPIDESTPDNAALAQQAKQGIYNAILKTFFNLKSDPKIDNDYKYFEFILEETVDELLDVLPQTEELKKMRYSWKIKVLEHAIQMLDDLHKLSDTPCFRQTIKDKFNRQFAIDNELQYCFILQQGFLSAVADAYILETNYKEKDPIKANIYKNRLMKEIDKLVNHMAKEHNVGFRFFNKSKLARITMKTLEKVPIPKDDILQDEVEEIHLTDEIEKWYKGLPTQPVEDEVDGVVRKRMIDILAKKLHDMHKHLSNEDPSREEKMKHEMSQFLEKKAKLQPDENLNINFMVDQLHYRLKNRWLHLQELTDFTEFEKGNPLSSTLTHVDNADFLAPLMDAASNTRAEPTGQRMLGDEGYFIQPGKPMQSIGQVRTSFGGAPYFVQDSGIPGSPQKALIHSIEPNSSRRVPYGIRISPGRPDESYFSYPEGFHVGPKQQSPTRQNLSLPVGRPSSDYTAPYRNTRGVFLPSQVGSKRQQNINHSLRQMGSQDQRVDQNTSVAHRYTRSAEPRQVFDPSSHQGRLQGQYFCEGSGKINDPRTSIGAGTTAQIASRASSSEEEDLLDGRFRVKCKCLEAYRKMKSLHYDDHCDRYTSHKSNF